MAGQLLIGSGKEIRAVADDAFMRAHDHIPERMAKRLAFMSADHHTVRDFVVREIPRQHHSLSPQQIAQVTGLDTARIRKVLDDLERNLFFLVRDARGHVTWAFPVTVERTRHRLIFSTGEATSGA